MPRIWHFLPRYYRKKGILWKKNVFLYKKIAYLYKEKTQKKPSPMTTDKKIIFFKQKKNGLKPDAKFRKDFSPHPQVAMRCMHQSNLIG
nr:MAG TPA: hypothetical protein [Caudoviricetes sp.]